MKAMKKINLLIIIILVFIAFATIDYFRIKSDNFPIFAINIVNNKNNKQIFIGPFYIVKREYKEQNEKFSESSNVYFNFEKINYKTKNNKKYLDFKFNKSDIIINKYLEHQTSTFYTANIDNLKINSLTLQDYLNNNSIDNLLKNALSITNVVKYQYKIYEYEKIKIMACNSSYDDNKKIIKKDYVITDKLSVFDKSFCQKKECIFKKTLKVTQKLDNYNINIIQKNNYNLTTVKVNEDLFSKLKKDIYYDFTFLANPSINKHDLQNIFNTTKIIDIKNNDNSYSFNDNSCN